MNKTKSTENILLNNKHILLSLNNSEQNDKLNYIKQNFCGIVIDDIGKLINKVEPNTLVYVCGDIGKIIDLINWGENVLVIKELSTNYDKHCNNYQLITLGEVPINKHNVGVFFRDFFDASEANYNNIVNEHDFQILGIKKFVGNIAHRKGIYLTNVEKVGDMDELKFKLMRCSTDLDGPTDNFRQTDKKVIAKANGVSKFFFKDDVELNHVLAQTYHNFMSGGKERKARISKHSDKTKDMPRNATMAFCSFYKDFSNGHFDDVRLKSIKRSPNDVYDFCYKKTSALTRLRFRLKDTVVDDSYKKVFDIVLYPNSLFLMPLSTNRLYTHETVPPALPVNLIPTRMGYVIRCSNTDAIYKNDQTYIVKHDDKCVKLEEPTHGGLKTLRDYYYKENTTTEIMDYENKFFFSMNTGDYKKPIL